MALSLHDRATRGESLSADEQNLLESWYRQEDAAESAGLGAAVAEASLVALRSQVDATLEQLSAAIKRIQSVTDENAELRRENTDLRRQLVRAFSLQSA
jgi:predicted  nucleic acid-binding Zn-ribbon protein